MDRGFIVCIIIAVLLFIFKSIVGLAIVQIYNYWIPVTIVFFILFPFFVWIVLALEKGMKEDKDLWFFYHKDYKPSYTEENSLAFRICIWFMGALFVPLVISGLVAEIIVGAYTELWGMNITPYESTIVKKEYYHSSGRPPSDTYWVHVDSPEFGKEQFDSYRMYRDGEIGDKVRIQRKVSSLGYTIQPNEMIIIKK